MGRRCTICTHKKQHQIDQCIVNNEEYSAIARKFGVSRQAVGRHTEKGHVLMPAIKARIVSELRYGQVLDDIIQKILDLSFEIASEARSEGSFTAIGGILGAACRAAELLEKVDSRREDKEQQSSGLDRLLAKLEDDKDGSSGSNPGPKSQ